jgi:hypothetical protein
MLIPESVINQLLQRGLVVSEEPFVSGHIAFPDGHIVGKPRTIEGNCNPEIECYWGLFSEIVLDAPTIVLHRDGNEWVVTVDQYVPGPGPGDFVNRHPTSDDAVADILDYFFGDPSRMAAGR